MAAVLTRDDIDFASFLADPQARAKVRPASDWQAEVIKHFTMPDEQRGNFLPWRSMRDQFRVRRNELTLWPGINGHGKSLALSQVMLNLCAQGERCLLISLEMRAVLTMVRATRQATRVAEPSVSEIKRFHSWTDERLWIYDHVGSIDWRYIIAVLRWAHTKLGITQFVIDSLMRCGIAEDDWNGQKAFIDGLCSFKNDNDVSVHLVMHARKAQDEFSPPGKFDAKGTGTITDLADNVLTLWRNKRKEATLLKFPGEPDAMKQPDAMLICDKQRNGGWEGRTNLWFHAAAQQFTDYAHGQSIDLITCELGHVPNRVPGEDDE